jgi:hypothetical protein
LIDSLFLALLSIWNYKSNNNTVRWNLNLSWLDKENTKVEKLSMAIARSPARGISLYREFKRKSKDTS